ncbi:hypothetical protein TWF106_001843 [Orbilia oligospora]|uniref:Mid2 domain-containing protein n=1 Tax=Orbilia oligospora TaxID=2813651 RepID=A0A6G1LZZ4_ORBOL|nr:hypothetical protein TWF106_001843 [Orbilia oligospora]KAF3215140.1 hypothetical protein TWF679_004388 [Orbilia oligospora]KAF3231145.1 hypothetical protein TWF191_007864 [Orbilia oligospora]KAF3240536.1 hypothetical protein TWF192_009436 [Orbilia oligospora]
MSSTSTVTRNVLGPLTTTFTPDPSCTIPAIYCPRESLCVAWQAQTCISGIGAIDQSFCWPSWTAGASVLSTPDALNGFGLYSPGLVCPYGNTPACSTTFGGEGNFQFQFPVTTGETAVGCCPSGYFCQQAPRGQTCVVTATSTTFDGVVCSDFARSPTEFIIPTSVTTTQVTGSARRTDVVIISTQTFFAPLFQLNWRSVDRPSSSRSNTGGSSVSQTQTDNQPLNTSDSDRGEEGGGGGLSTGAKAGIGAGVAVVALLLLGALVWFWKSRRKGDYGYGDVPVLPPPVPTGPAEFYTENKMPAEASADQIRRAGMASELPAGALQPGPGQLGQQTWELESRTAVHQLDSRPLNGY